MLFQETIFLLLLMRNDSRLKWANIYAFTRETCTSLRSASISKQQKLIKFSKHIYIHVYMSLLENEPVYAYSQRRPRLLIGTTPTSL